MRPSTARVEFYVLWKTGLWTKRVFEMPEHAAGNDSTLMVFWHLDHRDAFVAQEGPVEAVLPTGRDVGAEEPFIAWQPQWGA